MIQSCFLLREVLFLSSTIFSSISVIYEKFPEKNHRPSTRHHQVYHVRSYRVHLTLVVIASKVNGYQNACTIITIKATTTGINQYIIMAYL